MDLAYILNFLQKLAKNNDRVWFEKNKAMYLQSKEYFEVFVAKLLEELIPFNPEFATLNPKKLPFRIYRDVRFSKDKSPYKINMSAGFSPNGKLVQEPGYYIQLQPGNCFIAGGIYMPDAEMLGKIRQEIDYNGAVLEKIIADKKFRKWFGELESEDKLKTMPKGYAKDNPRIELLKNKSFIVSHTFTDAQVKDKKIINQLVEACKVMKPLNMFLKEAIS